MKPISENTSISISLLIMILGGAGYVTFTAFQSAANANAIQELRAKQEKIDEIHEDIAVIKTKIEAIEKRLGRK